jgi:anti-sigma factor RsiW
MNNEQLHAYVDGVATEADRRAVEAAAARDPDLAARLRAYAEQNRALHEAFDSVLDEPHSLKVPLAWAGAWNRWGGLAATLFIGIACGFLVRGWLVLPGAAPTLVTEAVLAHAAYVPEVRHPVEVGAAEEQHLVAWLSKRLSTPIKAPSLLTAGYQLLGGRLLPPSSSKDPAPMALLMYENAQGRRLSLLIKRDSTNTETAFRFSEDGATRVFYWIDESCGYALAGDLPKDELQTIARLVYRQLNP